jgi:geranylgeranyl reductase family protein
MISIIGAGPIGNYAAFLLAKDNHEVNLFEEHSEIGKPVQCTGITTNVLSDIIKIKKEFIVNKIKKIRVNAPNKNVLELRLRKENFILDREKFDKFLFNKAKDEGVNVFLNHKFVNYDKNKLLFNNKKIYSTDILVGADGPNSSVAKSTNLFGNRSFITGMQARVKGNFDKDVFDVFMGNVCPRFFAWIVPENEKVARIGLASDRNVSDYFKKFLRWKVLDKQVGLIPVYNPSLKTEKDNVYLVGDSATQVKRTTGGGLIPGLIAAEELAKSIKQKSSYEKNWKNRIGKDLRFGLIVSNILGRFSDKDFNLLIKLLKKQKTKNIIENYDREFPTKLLFRLILSQPGLLRFFHRLF